MKRVKNTHVNYPHRSNHRLNQHLFLKGAWYQHYSYFWSCQKLIKLILFFYIDVTAKVGEVFPATFSHARVNKSPQQNLDQGFFNLFWLVIPIFRPGILINTVFGRIQIKEVCFSDRNSLESVSLYPGMSYVLVVACRFVAARHLHNIFRMNISA